MPLRLIINAVSTLNFLYVNVNFLCYWILISKHFTLYVIKKHTLDTRCRIPKKTFVSEEVIFFFCKVVIWFGYNSTNRIASGIGVRFCLVVWFCFFSYIFLFLQPSYGLLPLWCLIWEHRAADSKRVVLPNPSLWEDRDVFHCSNKQPNLLHSKFNIISFPLQEQEQDSSLYLLCLPLDNNSLYYRLWYAPLCISVAMQISYFFARLWEELVLFPYVGGQERTGLILRWIRSSWWLVRLGLEGLN